MLHFQHHVVGVVHFENVDAMAVLIADHFFFFLILICHSQCWMGIISI